MSYRRIYHARRHGMVDSILIDSVYETTETHVSAFIVSILHQGIFSVTSLIVAIIYLSRFKDATKVSLHTYSWRLLFLTALLVADKATEDKPIKNGSLVKLFPVLTAEELSELEVVMTVRIRFSLFIKDELFSSFVEKLENERVSSEVREIVNHSDFAIHNLLPSTSTLPCTPEPMFFNSTPQKQPTPPTPVTVYPNSSRRSRSKQPQFFSGPVLSAQTVAPVVIEPLQTRGRSRSASRAPSFFDDSLEYSRSSSRRLSFIRPVPPPPMFEPARYQHRRYSTGRSIKRDPILEGTGAIQGLHAMAAKTNQSIVKMAGYRANPLSGVTRWNNLF
jgi:hypothetical protein